MIKRFIRSEISFWTILTLLSLAGGSLVYYTTAVAPWAFSDSTVYIAAGVNWIKGNGMGFTLPDGNFAHLVHFPPGYPVLLGLTSLLIPSPVDAARWINIISFILLIFLGAWLLWKITRSRLLPLLYGLIMIFSPFLLYVFSGVMSEPPAILAGTLALLLLVLYVKTNRVSLLVLAGLLSAGAVFIRYQQASVLLAGGVFLFFLSGKGWWSRTRDSLLYTALSAGPFGLWYLVDTLIRGGSGARMFGLRGEFSTITSEFFTRVYETTKYWFPWRSNLLPGVDAALVRLVLITLFVAFVAAGIALARRRLQNSVDSVSTKSLVIISIIYILADLVFLWAAMLFANPPPDIDPRMLSPLIPILFILILGIEYLSAETFRHHWWTAAVLLATAGLFILVFFPQAKKYASIKHGYGDGYTSLTFSGSPFIARLQQLAEEHSLVSNSSALVQFFTLKVPYRTFGGLNDPAIAKTIMFGDNETDAQQAFREDCAALVIFDPDKAANLDTESVLYYPPEVYHVVNGLVEIFSDPLGKIYVYPGCEGRY